MNMSPSDAITEKPAENKTQQFSSLNGMGEWGQIFILDFAKNIGVIHKKVGRILMIYT